MAVLILLAFAVSDSRGTSRSSSHPAALTSWARAAAPAITTLIDDSHVIERDSSPVAGVPAGQFSTDSGLYQRDLRAVQQLPLPPNPALAQQWRAVLQQAATASLALGGVRVSSPTDVAQIHVRFTAMESVLVGLEQEIHPA